MAIKAGWYKFNGVLTAPSQDLSVNIPFKIHVELSASVGMDEYTCSKMKVMADGEVRYVLTEGNIGSAESGVEFPYELTAYKDGWRTEYGYVDTIEVQADTEVSDEFVEWFAISTNPTDEPDEPDTPDIPDVPDTTKVIKAGTYLFNDVIDFSLYGTYPFTFCVTTGDGAETFKCYCDEIALMATNGSYLAYHCNESTPDLSVVGINLPSNIPVYYSSDGWKFELYGTGIQTITIPNDTEVSEKFYTWFNANAKIYTTISGTWVINNVPFWAYEHNEKVNFISNEKSYTNFNMHNSSTFDTLRYYYSLSEYDEAYYHDENGRIWNNEAYKTITFEGEQSVSQQFVDWLKSNATEVVEDKPLATITYNGSTIASILGGQKATLKCAGMTMESDVVVDVAEVDIPEGDIPEGYVKPEGALYISRNGTHDVTNFAEAVVNVKAEAETPDQNSVVPLTITENGVYEAPGKPDYKIEWDGNTEGLERVGQMYFVSDFEINDVEELNGIHGVYINGNSTEESELTFSPFSITGYEGYQGEGYFSSGLTSTFCWYVPGKGFAFNKSGDRYYTKSITIPEGGDPIVGYSPITVNVKGGGGESEAEKFFAENFPSDVWAEGEYTNSSLGVPITMRYLYRRDRQDPKEIAFVADVNGGYDGLQTANLADYYVFASIDVSYTVPVYDNTILLRNPVAPIFFDLSATYSALLGMEVSAILNATLCAMKDGTYDGSGSTYLNTQANFSAVVDGDFGDVKLTTILANNPTSMTWMCEADHALGGNITGVRHIKSGWLNITENGNYSWNLVEDGVDGVSAITVNVPTGGGDAEKYIEAQHAEVVLPNATSIKPYAFYTDKALVNIEMPKVTSIGDNAFQNCSKLALTSLPSGVTSIGKGAFNGCTKLALTSLPSGVTSIGHNAFNDCTKLTSITFDGKPTSIANNAFNNCTNLTTINVPWAEGEVANAPWGATKATINYNYTGG